MDLVIDIMKKQKTRQQRLEKPGVEDMARYILSFQKQESLGPINGPITFQ